MFAITASSWEYRENCLFRTLYFFKFSFSAASLERQISCALFLCYFWSFLSLGIWKFILGAYEIATLLLIGELTIFSSPLLWTCGLFLYSLITVSESIQGFPAEISRRHLSCNVAKSIPAVWHVVVFGDWVMHMPSWCGEMKCLGVDDNSEKRDRNGHKIIIDKNSF